MLTGLTEDDGREIGVSPTVSVPIERAWRVVTTNRGFAAWLGPEARLSPEPGASYATADGIGKRLFGTGTMPAALKLVDTKTSGSGVTMATYARAGEREYGSFALEQ